MMPPALLCLAITALTATAASARPGAVSVAGVMCPARLASAQTAKSPPGWTAQRSARDAPLVAMSIYDGAPADKVELAPDERRETGRLVAQWHFDRDVSPTLACRYRGTDVMLTRPLPASVRQCTLRNPVGGGLLDPTALRCR